MSLQGTGRTVCTRQAILGVICWERLETVWVFVGFACRAHTRPVTLQCRLSIGTRAIHDYQDEGRVGAGGAKQARRQVRLEASLLGGSRVADEGFRLLGVCGPCPNRQGGARNDSFLCANVSGIRPLSTSQTLCIPTWCHSVFVRSNQDSSDSCCA